MSKQDLEEQKEFYAKEYEIESEPRKFNDLLYGMKPYYMSALMPVAGRSMLCLGSGDGSKCRFFAENGAMVVATDIVFQPLIRMKKKARQDGLGVHQLSCVVADGHKLPFKDGAFAIVYGMGVLHHLENNLAAPEIWRVMKSDGMGLFKEPLGAHPLINLYRLLTPGIRTKSEHPFYQKDLKYYREKFPNISVTPFGFLTLCVAPLLKIPSICKKVLPLFRQLDLGVFRLLPFARNLAWAVIIVLKKSER